MMVEATARGHGCSCASSTSSRSRAGARSRASARPSCSTPPAAQRRLVPARRRIRRAADGVRRGADAQGPALRHGVRLLHLPARARGARRARACSTTRGRCATTTRSWRSPSSRSSPRRRIVTRDPARLRAFVDEHGEAVFKLLDGMGGASIFRARAGDPNLSVIIETMNQFGARTVMAQRYLPRDRRRRQARPADRRTGGALRAGAHSEGRRGARQPRRRRHRSRAAAVGARPRDRRGAGSDRWPRAACCWSAWT